MSKRTYGHVLVLPSRRLVCPPAEDDFVKNIASLKFDENVNGHKMVKHSQTIRPLLPMQNAKFVLLEAAT